MSALNNVSVQGRLSRDPELRYAPNGKAVCSISIFLENSFATKENTGGFMDVTVFASTAEFVAKHFVKGDAILICGSLKHDSWLDKETNKSRSKWSIVANSVHFCGGKRNEQNDNVGYIPQERPNYQQPQQTQPQAQARQYSNPNSNNYQNQNHQGPSSWSQDDGFGEDIPF